MIMNGWLILNILFQIINIAQFLFFKNENSIDDWLR